MSIQTVREKTVYIEFAFAYDGPRKMEIPGKNIVVCPMNESDLDGVLDIESYSFPHPWSRVHFLDELKSPHSFPLVALDQDGTVIGYICPMCLLDEGHIHNVAVHKNFRGHKIGKVLVETVIRECRERGASFLSLEVRTSNIEAIALYEGLGFLTTGKRKHYYQDGEDAFVMELLLQNHKDGDDAV